MLIYHDYVKVIPGMQESFDVHIPLIEYITILEWNKYHMTILIDKESVHLTEFNILSW